MGKVYDALDEDLVAFLGRQQMFFVASAPLAAHGLVNLSPKGLDTLRILGRRRVAYLDLTGSGIETVAHVRENGRLVMMFCAFEGPPRIVRLHGRAEVHERGSEGYDELAEHFPDLPGARSIVVLEAQRISDSCGFAVPRYDFRKQRDTLVRYAERQGSEGLRKAWKHNRRSLDGLPGLGTS